MKLKLAAVVSFIIFFTTYYGVSGWIFHNLKDFRRVLAISSITTATGLFVPVDAFAANPALEAATKAMLETKEKPKLERDISVMPIAAKKRLAISLCKEPKLYRGAGFQSATECNSAVLNGDVERIIKASPQEEAAAAPVRQPTRSTRSSNGGSTAVDAARPAQKTQDLSDLTTAQKKRRAIAACKRPELRRAAKAGSESKCTEEAMKGDFNKVIEALEYGF